MYVIKRQVKDGGIDLTPFVHYLLIYFMIIAQGASIFATYRLLWELFFCTIGVSYMLVKSRPAYRWLLVAAGIFVYYIIFLRIWTDGGVGVATIIDFVALVSIAYVAVDFDSEHFFNRFLNVVLFLAIVSCIYFPVCNILKDKASSLFLIHYSSGFSTYHGMLFYVLRLHDLRNTGIFYEPGVYQVLLVITIFALLYFDDRISISSKKRNNALMILGITVMTTLSTTAYVNMLILFGFFMFKRQEKLKGAVLAVSFLGFVILVADSIIRGENGIFYVYVLKKVFEITDVSKTYASSGGARYMVISFALKSLSKNPLGCGVNAFVDAGVSQSGAGFMYYLASLGIPLFLLILIVVFTPYYVNRRDALSLLAISMLYLNTTLAQSHVVYPCMLAISLLPSLKRKEIIEKYENSLVGKRKAAPSRSITW